MESARIAEALLEPDADLITSGEVYVRKQKKRKRVAADAEAQEKDDGYNGRLAGNNNNGGRELVAQTKRRSERDMKNYRRMMRDIKRTDTLRRAMIPRTKMNKSQLRRKKEADRVSFKLLRHVEDVHATVENQLLMQLEDPLLPPSGHKRERARRKLEVYRRNYKTWKETRMMNLVRASADDSREHMAREREILQREHARARRDHQKLMQPTLEILGFTERHHFTPDRTTTRAPGAKSKRSGGSSTLMQFFPRRADACKREVERIFREFYLERVSETFDFFIQDWPEYNPVKTEAEKEQEREKILHARYPQFYPCSTCKCQMVIDRKHAMLKCPQCGICVEGITELLYEQTFSESQATVRSAAPYQRLAHFKEFIVRLEGAERTEIPEIVINVLLRQCMAHNIDPRAEPERITYHLVREFLQKTKYAHFFENIPHIMSLLTGQPAMRFSDDEKAKLTQIFREIQEPFHRHKGTRKNFLSYSYTTFKSCELLGIRRFLPLLPLLKAPQNLLAADRIWERICEDCGYQFVRTI